MSFHVIYISINATYSYFYALRRLRKYEEWQFWIISASSFSMFARCKLIHAWNWKCPTPIMPPTPHPPPASLWRKELNLNSAQLSRKITLVKTRKLFSLVEFVMAIIGCNRLSKSISRKSSKVFVYGGCIEVLEKRLCFYTAEEISAF